MGWWRLCEHYSPIPGHLMHVQEAEEEEVGPPPAELLEVVVVVVVVMTMMIVVIAVAVAVVVEKDVLLGTGFHVQHLTPS